MKGYLKSVFTSQKYSLKRLTEYGQNKEPLEFILKDLKDAKIKKGPSILQRFVSFLPFENISNNDSLGEGNTPIIKANNFLQNKIGHNNIYFKNETQNPTWSFKDRGSLMCCLLAKEMNESKIGTISTGNMGHSMAAYGAHLDLDTYIFVPDYAPEEKIKSMGIHGSKIYKISAPSYVKMKKKVLSLADKLNLRIISGNHPIRVEGYKVTAFEIYERFKGNLPDYIAVPTSACGHIRGIFKGFKELKKAGYIEKLPKMIVVQAKNNAPIVKALEKNLDNIIPFENVKTLAKAITTGKPYGGKEIIIKAKKYNWLYSSVDEKEILKGQKWLAHNGLFVEPSSATSIIAIKNLIEKGLIRKDQKVLSILTGSGLKDIHILNKQSINKKSIEYKNIEKILKKDI
ncbi:MAG: threonine synthase [Bacillota bacterium]